MHGLCLTRPGDNAHQGRSNQNSRSPGSKTWEPDRLVHAVRPDTEGIKEAGWNGNPGWETGILGNVLPKKKEKERVMSLQEQLVVSGFKN